jgi:hypothetical protein
MDPFLAPHFQWDAQRLFKFDGTKYVRFIHEPHTADRFWEIQVCIPLFVSLYVVPFDTSLAFLLMGNHCAIFCTPTKPNFLHLEKLWDTQSTHRLATLTLIFVMVVVLVVVSL